MKIKCEDCYYYDVFTCECCNPFKKYKKQLMNRNDTCADWEKETEFEELESPDEN